MSLQAIIHHFFITILVVANLYYSEIVYGDNDVFTFKKRKKKKKKKRKIEDKMTMMEIRMVKIRIYAIL